MADFFRHGAGVPADAPARPRRTLRSLLMLMWGAVLLFAAGLVLEPASLQAVSRRAQTLPARVAHEEFAQSLAQSLSRSVEVLAVFNHSPTTIASLVVWMHDEANRGVIDPDEIIVITHSQLLRTLTAYTLDTKADEQGSRAAPSRERFQGPLSREIVSAPSFIDRWRAAPSVQPRVMATGISDMRIEPVRHTAGGNSRAVLRLALRWSADSADGPGEATAFIAASRPQKE